MAMLSIAVGCQSATLPPLASAQEMLARATYVGIMEEPVTLSGGSWQGAPYVPGGASRPTVSLIRDLVAVGQLNNDDVPEVAAILVRNDGGSGSFYYVAVLSTTGSESIVSRAAVLLGDRVTVRSLDIAASEIRLDLLEAGPADDSCCPSQPTHRRYRLVGEELEAAIE